MDYLIRPLRQDEYPLLDAFLYETIFVPEGAAAPPRSITALPELQLYVEGFGSGRADFCLLAEVDGAAVGAVWTRFMHDYGYVDDETPSLSIAVLKDYRALGIGTALMQGIFALLQAEGFKRLSLSVQKANYAAAWYQHLGFRVVADHGDELVMVKLLADEV